MNADRFSTCLPLTLAQECPLPADWSNRRNFSDDVHDPGGQTFCGITQREYDAWRKQNRLPTRDVRSLTEPEGQAIYLQSYWLPHCGDLPPGLDLQYFDSAVNESPTEATRILQVALGIKNDGMWTPIVTMAARGAALNPAAAIQAFTTRRQCVYQQSKGFQYFGKGWMKRATEIGAQALKMTNGG